MKKNSLLLLLLLCIPWHVMAQTSKEIHLKFSEKDFQFFTTDGLLHISTNKYNYGLPTSQEEPALPQIGISILIGADSAYSGMTVEESRGQVFDSSCNK